MLLFVLDLGYPRMSLLIDPCRVDQSIEKSISSYILAQGLFVDDSLCNLDYAVASSFAFLSTVNLIIRGNDLPHAPTSSSSAPSA